MARFSVIIPIYNKANYILKTLMSVYNQTYKDYEVIIVNDGSTDNSFGIISKIIAEHQSITKYYYQTNCGVSQARNKGITEATGEYISFLDADDEWRSDYLDTIDKLISIYTTSEIYATAYCIRYNNERIEYSNKVESNDNEIVNYWDRINSKYDFICTCTITIRKATLLKVGLFKQGESVGQDLDLWARIAGYNNLIAYSNKRCLVYNRHAENNARTRVKVAYPKAYLGVLENEIENSDHTSREIDQIKRKYNKKYFYYIFTLLDNRQRLLAFNNMLEWKYDPPVIYKIFLSLLMITPPRIISYIRKLRISIY